jgi:hypothetical protein
MKKGSPLTPLGKKVAIFGVVVLVAITLLALHAGRVHEVARAIEADGGYYAVSDKLNEFGLPEVVKKPLK